MPANYVLPYLRSQVSSTILLAKPPFCCTSAVRHIVINRSCGSSWPVGIFKSSWQPEPCWTERLKDWKYHEIWEPHGTPTNDFKEVPTFLGLIAQTICHISSGPRSNVDKFEEATQTPRLSLIMNIALSHTTDPVTCEQNTIFTNINQTLNTPAVFRWIPGPYPKTHQTRSHQIHRHHICQRLLWTSQWPKFRDPSVVLILGFVGLEV